MRLASQLSPYLVLAGAVLFLLPAPSYGAPSNNHSRFAGTYQSAASSDPSKPVPSMSASLGKDGTATITQDAGKGEKTSFGHWVDSGSQVTVTFDAVQGKPAEPPMVFQPSHDGLAAVTWDHAAWGKVSPPVMKKANADWHTKRHRFW